MQISLSMMMAMLAAWLQVPLVRSLQIGFYTTRCPAAEEIVSRLVRLASHRDSTLPAALLRLHYHDCFVGGCDASVLLDSAPGYPSPEKMAPPNQSLRGFDQVDLIKRVLEVVCPATVSCADILALSARDAVVLAGGPNWEVPTGRRDGRLSSAVLAQISLPRPQFSSVQLKNNFLWHGMSEAEMISLSGAHTIGSAICAPIWDRLYNHNSTNGNDPRIDSYCAVQLKKICPISSYNSKLKGASGPMTPFKFDNMYYKNLDVGLGLLAIDQVIHDNSTSEFSSNSALWESSFRDAMAHLGYLSVKTGSSGEIRRNCRQRN